MKHCLTHFEGIELPAIKSLAILQEPAGSLIQYLQEVHIRPAIHVPAKGGVLVNFLPEVASRILKQIPEFYYLQKDGSNVIVDHYVKLGNAKCHRVIENDRATLTLSEFEEAYDWVLPDLKSLNELITLNYSEEILRTPSLFSGLTLSEEIDHTMLHVGFSVFMERCRLYRPRK